MRDRRLYLVQFKKENKELIRHAWKIGSLFMGLIVVAAVAPANAAGSITVNGSDSGTVQVIAQPSPTLVVTHDVGTGFATGLGAYTLQGVEQIDLSTLAISHGAAVITTASGDQIFLTYSGQAMPTSTPGQLTSTLTATVVGGTGQYEHATGYLTFTSIGSLSSGFTETVVGMISTAGSGNE